MPSSDSACSILATWANSQQNWVRAVVGEIIDTRAPLSANALEPGYALFLAENKLSSDEPSDVPSLEPGDSEASSGPALTIQRISDVRNVNRLAPDQSIEFNPQMTVLFGENASGKSGYVRILKRAAAVRSAEDVLPDIQSASEDPVPHAGIDLRLGDDSITCDWNNESGVEPFTRVCVFDPRAVSVHLDDDLGYRYVPSDLALFEYAHSAIRAIRRRLEEDRDSRLPGANPFRARFQPGSSAYAAIESLGATTDLRVLKKLAEISDTHEEAVKRVREKVGALSAATLEPKLEVARSEKTLADAVIDAAEAISAFDWKKHNKRVAARSRVARLLHEATEHAFDDSGIPGVLSDEWSEFIHAGQRYLEQYEHAEYPSEVDSCPYCRQELGEVALTLVRKYAEFAGGKLQCRLSKIERRIRSGASDLLLLDAEALGLMAKQKIAARGGDESPAKLTVLAQSLSDGLADAQPALEGGEKLPKAWDVPRTAERAFSEATEIRKSLKETIRELSRKSGTRAKTLEKRKAELRDLEDRATLESLLPSIRSHVQGAKWCARASTTVDRFTSLLRSLTEESKTASEAVVNRDFETHFRRECARLRAPEVRLEFPGREGAAARRKTLDSEHKLSDILSEGEQKVIALADFLAEAATRKSSAPLVFDDPVNSFDYRRLQEVADRLVALSRQHQVVVFTHNIWFASTLLAGFDTHADAGACAYYNVTNTSSAAGLVTTGTHPRWDSPKQTKKRINVLVAEAEGVSVDEQFDIVERAYSSLRKWCEVVVEQELLQEVTQRYRPNVRMTNLDKIKFGALEAASRETLRIFDKCCRIMEAHSQPLETLNIRPSLAELKQDWQDAQSALDEYRKYPDA